MLALLLSSQLSLAAASESADIGSGTVGMSWRPTDSEIKQIRNKLSEELGPTATAQQAEQFYRNQLLTAHKLGDPAQNKAILDRWQARVPNSSEAQAQQCYWMLNNGNRQLGLQQCEMAAATWPDKYYLAEALAYHYLDREEFDKASQYIAQSGSAVQREAQRQSRSTHPNLLTLHRIQLSHTLLTTQFAITQGQQAKAEQQLAEADGKAAVLLADLGNQEDELARHYLHQSYIDYLEAKTRLLLRLANPQASLQALRQLNDYYRHHESGRTPYSVARMEIDYLIGSHHFQAAYDKLQTLKTMHQSVAEQLNSQWVFTLNREFNALMGLARWSEAKQGLDWMESHSQQDTELRRQLPGNTPRSLLALQLHQSEQAERYARRSLEINTRHYGSEHFFTRRSEGLLAAALWQQHKAAEAAPLFRRAFEGFTAPLGLTLNQVESGLNPLYHHIILSAYLDMLSKQTGDSQAFDLSFQVADLLRNSTVQHSVNESAVRAVAGQSGLGDLVRAQQNERYALEALYTLLDKQLQKPDAQQDGKRIAELRQQIAGTQQQLDQHQIELHKRFPRYDELTNPRPPSVAEVRRILQDRETLISILTGSDGVDVWAIAADGRTAFHHADIADAELSRLVGALRATLDPQSNGGRNDSFARREAAQLYQTLLEPVSSVIQGQKALTFSANGVLGRLPLSLLLTQPREDSVPLAQLPWLIRQTSVSYVPSVSSLLALRQLPHADQKQRRMLLAFGDPLFDLHSGQNNSSSVRNLSLPRNMDNELAASLLQEYRLVPPLPETREEIGAIVSSLHADPHQDVFLGRSATRQQVMTMRLDDRAVIDFSTHGLIAGDLPGLDQPALAMAATDVPGESPLLTLQDIMQLKLNADWVILSACNTAAADGKSSEAISGLGRGFFYAGSRSLLLTHWAVESRSAQQLVSKVFQHYAAQPGNRAEALRQAQLQLIEGKQYAHPMYWAAYALVGDGGN